MKPWKTQQLTVSVPNYGTLAGTFTQNEHGWFCDEVNGVPWDYDAFGAQTAKADPTEAAAALLNHAEHVA